MKATVNWIERWARLYAQARKNIQCQTDDHKTHGGPNDGPPHTAETPRHRLHD